jgi:hypothetical protein
VKDEVLSILIHGASKVGKSTLTSTAPPPILVIDAEGSWKFIRTAGFAGPAMRKVTWDPLQPPPRYDGTWDVCYVSVANWDTMRKVYAWLTQTEHDFVSIVLDSITELQRRLKTNIAPDGIIKGFDGWGALLVQMDNLIRGFRDLTISPGPVRCVVFVAESREESGKWRPYMQGQISISLPYWVDVCGYIFQTRGPDGDGNQTVKIVNLFVGTHPQFESGERVQGALPDNVVSPNITKIMKQIYPQTELSSVKEESA